MKINGKKVVDARRNLTLHITQRDVNSAKRSEHTTCAAARAIVRELGALSAMVGRSKTYVEFKSGWIRYTTPGALRIALMAFDLSGVFAPDHYILTRPHKGQELGARRDQTRSGGKGKYNPRHVFTGVRAALIRGQYHEAAKADRA